MSATHEPETVTLRLPHGALAGWPVLIDALRQAREATRLHNTFTGLIEQIEAQTKPPKPEVYEHLSYGNTDGTRRSLCGKIWQPKGRDEVDVVGKCPECYALSARQVWFA